MDWDARYFVSRLLSLKVLSSGKLALLGLPLRRVQELDTEALPVLLAFASGITPREALGRLREEWDLEEGAFEEVVEKMVEEEILEPAEPTGAKSRPGLPALGFGSVRNHFSMLKDTVRVMSYRAAIERHARDRVVVEIGCGTGILSLFAAKAGARRVIAIEASEIADIAMEMFAANGCAGTIELRNAHSRSVELDEPADLIIHEILGVDPFEENLLPTLEDARRRLLRPGGRFLPYRLEVCCMGVELAAPSFDEERLLAQARELPSIYGLDFAPVLRALEESSQVSTSGRTWIGGKKNFEPRILSEECRLLDLDLATDPLDLTEWTSAGPLRIVHQGILGGVVLFFRAHLDERTQLSTSPHAPETHWGWDVRTFSKQVPVSSGDEVALAVSVELKGPTGTHALEVRLT